MASDEPQPASDYEGAGAALEFAMWSLDEQLRAIQTTDGKSERAITLGVAIVTLFSGALTFQLGDAGRGVTMLALGTAVLVVGCFVAAVWLFFRSYAAVNWYLGPDSEELLAVSGEHGDLRSRQWLAEQLLSAVGHNAAGLQTKTIWSTWLFRAVLLEAVLAGGGVAALAILSAAN